MEKVEPMTAIRGVGGATTASTKETSLIFMDSTLTSPGLITDESRTDRGGVNDDQ